jgi:hypothetical protein
VLRRVFGAEERATEVDRNPAAPLQSLQGQNRFAFHRPGIVDENIDAAEALLAEIWSG